MKNYRQQVNELRTELFEEIRVIRDGLTEPIEFGGTYVGFIYSVSKEVITFYNYQESTLKAIDLADLTTIENVISFYELLMIELDKQTL